MKRPSIAILAIVGLFMFNSGCGHYPAPIRSAWDITWTSSAENMVVIVDLPLKDWPKLQKFSNLEHFRVAEQMSPKVSDEHARVLSQLNFPKLRQISFAYCTNLTDEGIQALTNLPAIQGLHLIGIRITDRSLGTMATGFPHLTGINVEDCRTLTISGFMTLTNSTTVTDVSFSVALYAQNQIEGVISNVTNVTWWTLSDPRHQLDEERLRRLGECRNITIQVADENRVVHGLTMKH